MSFLSRLLLFLLIPSLLPPLLRAGDVDFFEGPPPKPVPAAPPWASPRLILITYTLRESSSFIGLITAFR